MTRPTAAPTPSTWKYVPETSSPGTRSVWPFTPTFIAIGRRANSPEKIGVGRWRCGRPARLTRGRAGAGAAIDEVVAEVFVHRERQHVAARVAAVVVPRAVEQDELFGVLHRQPPQQHLVHEREDGGVGADAERDRHQRDAREQRRADEAAEA